MTKLFYEKNRELLEHPVNKTFEEILGMSKKDFREWVIQLRKVVVDLWDNKNLPPRVGYDESEIIEQFNDMLGYPVHEFLIKDEMTGEKDVVRNTSNIGNAVNQWFPTMMKTRINYSAKNDGKSIYDFFAKLELLDTFVTYATRHFKRDSFYHYSRPIEAGKVIEIAGTACLFQTGDQFVDWWTTNRMENSDYGYWIDTRDRKEYTGYNEDLKGKKYLTTNEGIIRFYENGQKLFPIGLKAFRVSFCQYATNYPPLTAKWVYDTFTEEFKDNEQIVVWDPSAGWGGRILGAMAAKNDRRLLYLGNDPNTDHYFGMGNKYDAIANFFNENTYRDSSLFPSTNEHRIWCLGSEVMRDNVDFKKYKGRVSLVFTSPPYFAKEAYSEDPTQSYKKFGEYDAWRDGFLKPTLETAVEWLHKGGYVVWNIADAKFGKDMLPLEKDSCDILESLGMKFVKKYKMVLGLMPGGNRTDEDGNAKAKNFCKIKSVDSDKIQTVKYEPIFVWRKP